MVNRLSIVRNFAYLFISSERAGDYGLITRVVIPLMLLASLSITYVIPGKTSLGFHIILILIYESILILRLTDIKMFLSSITLILLVIFLGFAIYVISPYMGSILSLNPLSIAIYGARMAGIIIAISLFFHLITFRELTYIAEALGLSKLSLIMTVALSQLPLTMIQFSEAIVSARLKYGRKGLILAIKSIIVDAILSSRSIAEVLYLYGLPKARRPMKINIWRDLPLLISSTIISITPIITTIPTIYIQPLG